jgi:hypothetical protein
MSGVGKQRNREHEHPGEPEATAESTLGRGG